MKQTLQLRLGQTLTMTPQLQQAIRLLQLSTLDLQQEIQQILESNMMLEAVENADAGSEEPAKDSATTENEVTEVSSEGSQTDMPDELPVDTSWEDVYDSVRAATPSSTPSEQQDTDYQRVISPSLQEHLVWQMSLTPFSDQDVAIATAIIDSVNEAGYLISSVEDIHKGLLEQLDDLDLDEVEAVLHRVQHFDPLGVAATDLGDCLRIQLEQLPEDTQWRPEALHLVRRFLNHLAAQDLGRLRRGLGLTDEQLVKVVELVRSLDPRPGLQIESSEPQYVVPDVFVTKQEGEWRVALNPDVAPKLRVNPFYSGMIKRADNSTDNTCMKNHLQEARWFLKSLQSRSETLLKVARCIVDRQQGFLDHGAVSMKPLILKDVAEEVEMHESTISRVTTQKYMHTPNGIYEFKYFFSSHVSTVGGGECSSTAIRAFIKELVEHENPVKPLSDSKISGLLKEEGINVARRTVAKYREAMSIASSSQRKRVL